MQLRKRAGSGVRLSHHSVMDHGWLATQECLSGQHVTTGPESAVQTNRYILTG